MEIYNHCTLFLTLYQIFTALVDRVSREVIWSQHDKEGGLDQISGTILKTRLSYYNVTPRLFEKSNLIFEILHGGKGINILLSLWGKAQQEKVRDWGGWSTGKEIQFWVKNCQHTWGGREREKCNEEGWKVSREGLGRAWLCCYEWEKCSKPMAECLQRKHTNQEPCKGWSPRNKKLAWVSDWTTSAGKFETIQWKTDDFE